MCIISRINQFIHFNEYYTVITCIIPLLLFALFTANRSPLNINDTHLFTSRDLRNNCSGIWKEKWIKRKMNQPNNTTKTTPIQIRFRT